MFKGSVIKNFEENLIGLPLFGSTFAKIKNEERIKELQELLNQLFLELTEQMKREFNDGDVVAGLKWKDLKIPDYLLKHILNSPFYNHYYKYLLISLLPEDDKPDQIKLIRNIQKSHSSAVIDSTYFLSYIILIHHFEVSAKFIELGEDKTKRLPIYHTETFKILGAMFKQKEDSIRNSLKKNLYSHF
jgi:hypothetical protein